MLKEKLTSRKLWIGVALVVIGAVICIAGDTSHGIELICLGGCGYLGVETICDIARAIWSTKANENSETEMEENENG